MRNRPPERKMPRYTRQGNLFVDMIRGYFYFTQQASCYILATCAVILLPLAICGTIGYMALTR